MKMILVIDTQGLHKSHINDFGRFWDKVVYELNSDHIEVANAELTDESGHRWWSLASSRALKQRWWPGSKE